MTFYLKEIAGQNIGGEYSLLPGENLVGRSRSSTIRVYNENVSGKHFILVVSDDGVLLRNLSHYGTLLDDVIVQDSAELQVGQKIRAGKSLCLEFLQRDEKGTDPNPSTAEETSVTKFVSDMTDPASPSPSDEDENLTGITKFAPEISDSCLSEGEVTNVTKFAADITSDGSAAEEENDISTEDECQTSVTRIAADASQTAPGWEDDGGHASDMADQTGITRIAPGGIPDKGPAEHADTDIGTNNFNVVGGPAASDETSGVTNWEKTSVGATEINAAAPGERREEDCTGAASQDIGSPDKTLTDTHEDLKSEKPDDGTFLEEQGMFFEEEASDESEKTNANETQVVQTRMASADEMNFIKDQIKKQQQSRLFFKFLV